MNSSSSRESRVVLIPYPLIPKRKSLRKLKFPAKDFQRKRRNKRKLHLWRKNKIKFKKWREKKKNRRIKKKKNRIKQARRKID
jgi:hypothetical protein